MAGRSNVESKKVRGSKYKVQFDNRTVRMWVLPLLRRIDVGDYPTRAGRIIGLSRQHVAYYIKKLEKCKLIRREKRSRAVFYTLTDEGKKLVTSCEGRIFPAQLYRLDKCQVSYAIKREGYLPKNFKPIEMKNWTALLGLEQGVKVRHTSKSWIVHVEVIRGRNPVEVSNLAINLANRVATALCLKYRCVLGEAEIVGGEMAVEDPVAALFGRYFTVRTDKRKIDHSWNFGELEHLQKDAVVDYLQMPERVKNVESEVEALRGDVGKLINALSKLFDLEGENGRGKLEDHGGANKYVA